MEIVADPMPHQSTPNWTPSLKLLDIEPDEIFQLSVEQYHAMVEIGILVDDDPVELLDGYLVQKARKTRPHVVTTYLVREEIQKILPNGWFVQPQEPFTTETSEPEPDVAIVRGKLRDYAENHPLAKDVPLVIEVADSTLRRDRTTKLQIYAAAGVPEYWIVNLNESLFEVYTEPSGLTENPAYGRKKSYGRGSKFDVRLDNEMIATLAVDDLLP